jgi:hypothetical protein
MANNSSCVCLFGVQNQSPPKESSQNPIHKHDRAQQKLTASFCFHGCVYGFFVSMDVYGFSSLLSRDERHKSEKRPSTFRHTEKEIFAIFFVQKKSE